MNRNKFTIFAFLTLFVCSSGFSADWEIIWQDEFNDSLSQDWIFDIGYGQWGWGNDEWQNYTTDNAFIVDSALVIRATVNGTPGKRDGSVESAKIKTKGKFNVKYGKIEARIKMSLGNGSWPAFWMLGSNIDEVVWPKCGEIDIMENVNGDNIIHGTAHWEGTLAHDSYGNSVNNVNLEEYHVYTIIWDQLSMIWQLDGETYSNLDIIDEKLNEFQKNFYIILNLAMGGQWPGPPDITSFPSEMIVDYVRVYKYGQPRMGAFPSCLRLEMQPGEALTLDPQTVNITNTGIDTLNNVTVDSDVDWLNIISIDNEGNEQSFEISINENANQLLKGSHIANISMISSNAAPGNVQVHLQVGTNLVLNNIVKTSSIDPDPPAGENVNPSNVNDGDISTRWSSEFSDTQWVSINLSKLPSTFQYSIESVKLYWDSAYAVDYEIQLSSSSDFSQYDVIAKVTNGDGGIDQLMTDNSAAGRYIRLYCLKGAAEYGYSLYEFEVYQNVATDIKDVEFVSLPDEYKIQNAPNPFNPSTTISYTLPKTQQVKLELYDFTGKRIKTMLSEVQTAGTHKITFYGNNLASGLYICRLKTPTISLTHKMLLLK